MSHQGNSGNIPTGFRLSLQYSIFCIFISIYQVHPHHPEPHGGVALPGTLNPAYWRHGLYLSISNKPTVPKNDLRIEKKEE